VAILALTVIKRGFCRKRLIYRKTKRKEKEKGDGNEIQLKIDLQSIEEA
jgi:hypothetical protein